MVVIVDLDDDDVVQQLHHTVPPYEKAVENPVLSIPGKHDVRHEPAPASAPPVERTYFRSAMTHAFGQYPVVWSIVQHIDLNTLDSLARTSFLIHQGLVQYRSSLIKATLHCVNNDLSVDPDSTLRYRARAGNHYFDPGPNLTRHSYLPYNGKSGECARDLVGECRKCGIPVCRNCTIKRPSQSALNERHRRLCFPCSRAPLASLLDVPLDPDTSVSSDLVQNELCHCDQNAGVWLCQPCGRGIRASDSDYSRIWRWRSQYGEVLGGLGTGIGDGDRGVICGREGECIAGKEVEQETDCDAEDAREPPALSSTSSETSLHRPASPMHRNSSGNASVHSHLSEERRTPSPLQLGPGYERHEIVGIGGVVKRKLVRMVRVGACVPEWEDERSRSENMRREKRGQVRSFCGWCCRIIPGEADKKAASTAAAAVSASSSPERA